jgi:hypothetical protein
MKRGGEGDQGAWTLMLGNLPACDDAANDS